MQLFCTYFLLFLIYSFSGWLMETILTLFKQKKFINRGFLIGPYCPIYGVSSIIMVLYLNRYIKDFYTVFILAVLICSVFEYFTSYIMEKIFKTRWWDYTHKKFNINGRICLNYSLAFGVMGTLLIYIINPFFLKLINKIPATFMIILSIILIIIFITDVITSFNIITKVKKNFSNIRKDSTEEITLFIKQYLNNNQHFFQRRILKAFPKIRPIIKKNK